MKRKYTCIIGFMCLISILISGCAGNRYTFFPGLEKQYNEATTAEVMAKFFDRVKKQDFSDLDYAYEISTSYLLDYDGPNYELSAYKNFRNTVLEVETLSEGNYYFNASEGILHHDVWNRENNHYEETSAEKKQWADFQFEEKTTLAHSVLKELASSSNEASCEFEYVDLAWNCKYILRIKYDWQDTDWPESFGACRPLKVIADFPDADGAEYQSVYISWLENGIQYSVSWNSYDDVLQSDRAVIRYEYEHGLREDNVPALSEQRKKLAKELEKHQYY